MRSLGLCVCVYFYSVNNLQLAFKCIISGCSSTTSSDELPANYPSLSVTGVDVWPKSIRTGPVATCDMSPTEDGSDEICT